MSNTLLTDKIIAKASIALLTNNLVMAPLVTRKYEKSFGKVGDSIQLKKAFRAKATSGATLAVQPLVDVTTNFKVKHQYTVGLDYTTRDMTLSIANFADEYLKGPVAQIANAIDRSLLLEAKLAFHSTHSATFTTPSTYLEFANAAAMMTTYATPMDGMRKAVLNPYTCAGLSSQAATLFNNQIVQKAYKAGQVGKVAGLDLFESNNIPTHTVGDHDGTPKVFGDQSNGNTIDTDGWGSANNLTLLNVGDVFTMDQVFGVNPQNYETTGLLQHFVVTEAAKTDGSSRSTITVSPAMNDGAAVNDDGVSLAASQNITALPANDADINVIGVAGSTYEQNYLFHRDAISLAMVNLEPPKSAVVKESMHDKDTGYAMLLTQAYDVNAGSERIRLEAVWATGLIHPELAYRMWGKAV